MISEADFVDAACPHCGEPVSFPQMDRGLVRACPRCSHELIVPTDARPARPVPIPITTPNLRLRRLAPADWKDLMACAPETDEAGVLRWLENDALVRLTTADQPFTLGIELPAEGKLIGSLSLSFSDPTLRQATLDYLVNEAYAARDFALESVQALLAFCFQDIHLHRVTSLCDSRNVAAARLFEAAGFRREGECLKDRWISGEWVNTIWFALLQDELLRVP